ncbi:MRPL32-like protein [Lachancea thermotolerans]|uniref:Large ribosomal subunit protein bL32m n=1 Tax=Lachancea thermotolerans (strain ATCC 56472 / CBS 6340 / NRRL Y-8284) TaxID=559295 RepID=C5E3D7_LACTC|nr:mitochondrial 54S ribosomal protein YmL32 [Lachancea thermotolerans CBS 6340]CAR30548.1 KLTH0H12540p [Lachancea thermotolerans CBS 6340]
MSFVATLKKRCLPVFSLLPSWSFSWQLAPAPTALPRLLHELLEGQVEPQLSPDSASPAKEGILLAVPKKKVSHQKKRQKLYGPGRKQLQMIHHLNRCPSCGHFKRANTLCMHCVGEIRHIWKSHTVRKTQEPLQEQELSNLDKRILYPGKKETEYAKKLKDKDSYLDRRMRSLPAGKNDS